MGLQCLSMVHRRQVSNSATWGHAYMHLAMTGLGVLRSALRMQGYQRRCRRQAWRQIMTRYPSEASALSMPQHQRLNIGIGCVMHAWQDQRDLF